MTNTGGGWDAGTDLCTGVGGARNCVGDSPPGSKYKYTTNSKDGAANDDLACGDACCVLAMATDYGTATCGFACTRTGSDDPSPYEGCHATDTVGPVLQHTSDVGYVKRFAWVCP